ncbi:MAG: caspase family protein [Fibrobacterales bacterium]
MVRFVIFCLALLSAGYAGELQRLALFIGNNSGLANEVTLKYAAKDAEEMARLLIDSQTFPEDRVYLLKNRSVGDIKNAFIEINGRAKELKRNGQETMVLLFYSGHGSSNALHINGHTLSKDELTGYFETLSADLKIMFVDACESGNLLRQKGGQVIKNHRVHKDELKSKGSIVITSSARGEFAQESEEYQGAVFTHHLLNALRGAADFNLDAQVSLFEAFEYARNSTQNEMILGKTENQNPGFDMNIVGESDVILARVQKKLSNITFKGFPGVMMTIHDASNSQVYSRLFLSGKETIRYSVPRGRYILSYEDGDAIKAQMIDLAWSNKRELTPKTFRKQHKSVLYAKGSQRLSLNAHGVEVGARFVSPLGESMLNLTELSYIHRSYNWKQRLSIGYASSTDHGSDSLKKSVENSFYSIAYNAGKPIYQHAYGQVSGGVNGRYVSLFQERFDNRLTKEGSRTSHANLYQIGLSLDLELYLPKGFWIATIITPEISLFTAQSDGKLKNRYYVSPGVALGYQF